MNPNILTLGGVELVNNARTYAYIKRLLPRLDVQCEVPSTYRLFQDKDYATPRVDKAPWVSADTASHEFLGMIPSSSDGLESSTQTVAVEELKGDGAAMGLRRNQSREIRVRGVLYATTRDGLRYGMDWFADRLSGGYCPPNSGIPCEGETLISYPQPRTSRPKEITYSIHNARAYHDCKVLEGIRAIGPVKFDNAEAMEVEFILAAGNPFIFRARPVHWFTMVNPTGSSADESRCRPERDAYNSLITDPALGSVVRPPRPAEASPIEMPSSWRRQDQWIDAKELNLPGQMVFNIRIVNPSADLRKMRLRIYRRGAGYCDFSGEFLITYMPKGTTLIIDGITRSVKLERENGDLVPAGNLVIGSYGRPSTWPEMDCKQDTMLRVEYPGVIPNVRIATNVYNRR